MFRYERKTTLGKKHKAYHYTPLEENNGCVIFGTAGHGSGLYCYRTADGTCLCAIDTKGTLLYCWYNQNISCQNRNGVLIVADSFEGHIKHEIKLDGKFTENSGFYADDRYICTVGFMKKTNWLCIYLFDTLED